MRTRLTSSKPLHEDDDQSKSSFGSSDSTPEQSSSQVNDLEHERKELQKLAQKESHNVQIWRRNVCLTICAVCALVT
jgi:hypothetical protein